MKRRVIRLLTMATLAIVLAATFAAPAYCKTKKSSKTVNQHNLEYVHQLPVSAALNKGTTIVTDIGNLMPQKAKIGSGLISVQAFNFNNMYSATGTSTTGSALPYSKISTVDANFRPVLVNAVQSLGYAPGGMFDLEIGDFTNYSGYHYGNRLAAAMNYEVFVWPVAGYTPKMMVLLPDGTFRMLNDSELDRSLSGMVFVDGTQLFTLHTFFPKGIYMLVYVPQ